MREDPKIHPENDPAGEPEDPEDLVGRIAEKGAPAHAAGSHPGATPQASAATEAQGTPEAPAHAPRLGLHGARKAAVFILSLDEEVASPVLRCFTDEELSRIAVEISRLGVVEKDSVATVMHEFRELEQLYSLVREGGIEQATRILERSFPRERAHRILQHLAGERRDSPFAFLETVEIETLMAFLEEEHPQTLAVILVHLSPAKAAEILERLSPACSREVIERIATLEGTNAEALEEVEMALEKHLVATRYEPLGEAGGVKAVAEILRAATGNCATFLDDLRQDQPELAEEIDKHLFVFDDLVRLDDRAIQIVLREVDSRRLAVALKTSGEGIKMKVLNNLSRRAAEALREEMELLGPVRQADVEAAQRAILKTVLALEQSGQLACGRGREENRVYY